MTARRFLLPALASVAFGGTSYGETIEHGVPPDPGDTIPTGSQSICPGVPPDTPLIAQLRTGRAMPGTPSGSVRLLFSDQPLACDPNGVTTLARQTCGVSSWSFSLSLLPEMQTPGTYALSDYPVGFEDEMSTAGPDGGCGAGACSGGGFSTGGASAGGGRVSTPGVIEIYRVTDLCITGRFQGLMTGQISPPPPDLDGAFHAVRCTPAPPPP
jgi:hypothetical protein